MSSKAAAAPADGEKPKGKGKLVIILVAVIVLLAAAGGAFFFLKKGHGDEGEGEGGKDKPKAEKKHKSDPGKPPTFVPLEPFTVNLKSEGSEQYLQTVIALRVEDPKEADKLKAYMPEVRNDILMLLSGKKASELAEREGREHLAEEIKDAVNSIIGTPAKVDKKGKKSEPEGPVEKAIFSTFIVQ